MKAREKRRKEIRYEIRMRIYRAMRKEIGEKRYFEILDEQFNAWEDEQNV